MGHRANYIFKDGDKLTIHYHHWRAINIASDLYLGEKRFLEFVHQCQINDEIMDEPWIEGCVIVDRCHKELFFWSLDFIDDTSIVNYYLKKLSKKWIGWKISILKNKMYDVEKVLGIDYISRQEIQAINKISKEDILSDEIHEYLITLVIIKQGSSLFATKIGTPYIENIIRYGQDIIPIIRTKPQDELPKEGEGGICSSIIIDDDTKKVFIGSSIIGLLETSKHLWQDYDLIMRDFGYIEMLRLVGLQTSKLELSNKEIKKQFNEIVKIRDTFNLLGIVKKIIQEHEEVQFSPNFFDDIQPKKFLIEKLKLRIRKILGQK